MAAKDYLGASNIMFIIAGLYFIALAGLNESSVYVVVGSLLCFVSAAFALRKKWFFAVPWRVASACFVLVLTAFQVVTVTLSPVVSTIGIASALLNGLIFILFLGVLLASAKEIMKKAPKEEVEEKKEAKKLTYEI